jgi:hypothetical protein
MNTDPYEGTRIVSRGSSSLGALCDFDRDLDFDRDFDWERDEDGEGEVGREYRCGARKRSTDMARGSRVGSVCAAVLGVGLYYRSWSLLFQSVP